MLRRVVCVALTAMALFVPGLALAQNPAAKFEEAIAGCRRAEGLWTVFVKEQQFLVDLKNNQLNQDFLVLTSIARGVSSGMVIGGMTWGDDVLWSFRKVGDKVHVLRRNVRFKAKPGSPEASAVKVAYSDSVLYALPIIAESNGGQLVDMTRIFLSDDEQIGRFLGANFVFDRSTFESVKAFPKNLDLQVAAVYSGQQQLDSVADSRGTQVAVHYSISTLPQTGYKPRLADDRVGYFLTVTKDFTDNTDDENFVRYINRWDLQKADAAARVSPPKEPIIFWMEKTVPINLRPIVRAGIEEWNKAFEKVGFANAIEVRQQRDDDTWDPEDVRYNTFRWITANAGFAIGPSRVNPQTGQIVDADILFDADFLRYWKQDYQDFSPTALSRLFGDSAAQGPISPWVRNGSAAAGCSMSYGMQHQMGFAAAAMLADGTASAKGELPEEFLMQALKEVVMHEVGHTLGLRHNFKASAWKTLAEIDDPNRPKAEPIVASVMDYSPVNIAPEGTNQGAYYTNTLGPYDYWAIDYGYRAINGEEGPELLKIAARSGEPGLDYLTDEDTRGSVDPDPLSNRFDLGKDPVAYAQRQMAAVQALLPKLLDRTVTEGNGYQRARQAFARLYGEYWRALMFASRLPGGVYVHRDHKGDANTRLPFKPVEAAQQRAATELIVRQAMQSPKFDPTLLNSLAASRWDHWGTRNVNRVDYPIHETVLRLQTQILQQMLSGLTLQRLQDGEVKIAAADEAYTLADHLALVVDGLFSEVLTEPAAGEFSNRTPYLPSFRRNLQRVALKELIELVATDRDGVPDDAQVLIRMHLQRLTMAIAKLLAREDLKLDDYSRAHLFDSQERIKLLMDGKLAGGGGAPVMLFSLGQPGSPGVGSFPTAQTGLGQPYYSPSAVQRQGRPPQPEGLSADVLHSARAATGQGVFGQVPVPSGDVNGAIRIGADTAPLTAEGQ